MKISKREFFLIAVALLLLGFTVLYKLGLGMPFQIQPGISQERLLTERLQKAQALIGREKSILRQAMELRRLKQRYIQHTNPDEWTMAATGDIAKVTASVGVHPEIIKPGIPKNEDGLSVIPVQLKVSTSIPVLMDLLAVLPKQLPAVRVMRCTMTSASDGNCTVELYMDYLFPASGDKSEVRRTTGSKQPYISSGDSWRLLKKRISNPSKDWQQDWTRLMLAFGLPATYSGGGATGVGEGPSISPIISNNPILLGIVSRGDQVQALIQLGGDAWYLSPGEMKGGIRLAAIRGNEVTLYYQGRRIRLQMGN